ncbi:YicC/YloC family endoribonuclease [Rhodospirillum sp. A1_3_36]|uniref:YicC/YloC family endoribonuclease n=1 Tax=Rhodospirillum sp. A1_3_36 TaxID=3391666 RepID=UPI0039A6E327
MAPRSMTGFARAQGTLGSHAWAWEARSVNGKGLDLRLRMPPGSDALDQPLRKAVAERFKRGNMTVNLNVTRADAEPAYRLNEPLLRQLVALAADWKVEGVDPARMDGLLAMRGVLEPMAEDDEDEATKAAREAAMITSLLEALDGLAAARAEEGARLTAILLGHLDRLESLRAEAAAVEALRPDVVKERMRRQIADLLETTPDALNSDRLAQELALLAVKGDIREELDRLGAHLDSARDMLGQGEPVGRRLEFLSQELNREANTLCSKSQDVALTQIGLEIKAVIDQFREQILNIE